MGEWSNNLQHGKGIHVWYEPKGELKALRNRYIGEWQNGIRNGYGDCEWAQPFCYGRAVYRN